MPSIENHNEGTKGPVLEIRGLRIGEGIPKIIVPIVDKTRESILQSAQRLKSVPCDMAEWRMDWYGRGTDPEAVLETAGELRKALGEKPLLCTFRTKKEGGEQELSARSYTDLNRRLAASGYSDLIDAELFTGEEFLQEIIETAHENHVGVIASSHDFQKTPPKEEIIRRLRKMQDLGADILKIAVMPQNRRDVLTLLEATAEMREQYADRPLITMSMGSLGLISRLSGETFGSAATFGSAGRASAPGQMEAEDLRTVLQAIHKSMKLCAGANDLCYHTGNDTLTG